MKNFSISKKFTKRTFMYIMILIIFGILFLVNCSQSRVPPRFHYPELIYQQGNGTLLLFSTEDERFFLSDKAMVGEAGNREGLTNRIQMFLNIIEEDYHDLRIIKVDVIKEETMAKHFQIYDIPTLILVNKYGNEVRRWLPVDFEISGGSIIKLKEEIEKLKEPNTHD